MHHHLTPPCPPTPAPQPGPKYCRLRDFARVSGLFAEESLPSYRTVHRWLSRGLIEAEYIGTGQFINIPKSIAKLTRKLPN